MNPNKNVISRKFLTQMKGVKEENLIDLQVQGIASMKEDNQLSSFIVRNKNIKSLSTDDSATDDNEEEIQPSCKRLKLSIDNKSSSEINQSLQSPRKRINVPLPSVPKSIEKQKYIYGNYSRYYGYRNTEKFHDIRLDVFAKHSELFDDKEILDIGCNSGLITIEISKKFKIKSIIGIDIDKSLINKAKKFVQNQRKNFHPTKEDNSGDQNPLKILPSGESNETHCNENKNCFPFNINFVHGNYVLRDDVLLEIEKPQFDVILCLSVTKWIHLNFGDSGLKQVFRRMYKQLRPGGKLLLEPQSWDGYKRRKKLTPEIFNNFKSIEFFPNNFKNYLLGPEVGFSHVHELELPEHCQKGFRRPIYVYFKNANDIR